MQTQILMVSTVIILSKPSNILKELFDSLLTKREKEILVMRYGLFGNEEVTQREIGKKLGISRSYVSRIEKKALLKLNKGFLKSNL